MRLEKASHISNIISAICQAIAAVAAIVAAYTGLVLLHSQPTPTPQQPAVAEMSHRTAFILFVCSLAVIVLIPAIQWFNLRRKAKRLAEAQNQIEDRPRENAALNNQLRAQGKEVSELQQRLTAERERVKKAQVKTEEAQKYSSEKVLDIERLNSQLNELQKELISVRSDLIEAKGKAEANSQAFHDQSTEVNRLQGELAKYQQPEIVPVGYNKLPTLGVLGFEMANDGEPAYDLTIPPVRLRNAVVTFEADCPRLTKDGSLFWRVLIQSETGTVYTGNNLMNEMQRQGTGEMDVAIHYRDRANSYITICRFEVNVLASRTGGISIRKISQKPGII